MSARKTWQINEKKNDKRMINWAENEKKVRERKKI